MASEIRALDPDPPRGVRPVILVVDDEPGVRESFHLILDDDYEVIDVPDGAAALDVVRATQVDLVLLDIRLPGMDGIEVLERIKAIDEGLEVILVTAVKTVRTAVAAMKLGAFDYVTKPFEEDELLALVRRALEKRSLEREVVYLRGELERHHDFDEIVGQHPEMQRLYRLVAQVARTTTTVLITGESGTGKELIARAIHRQGPRRDKPFVAVNPAAIAETLMESELFGHEKGAFTGAFQRKLGKFELAQGGTLFLDEIATLRSELQAKLLRVLQEREIERVGGTRAIKIDVRIIAATNADVPAAVSRGTFREDLYYRLNVVPHHRAAAARAGRATSRCWSSTSSGATATEFGKRIEGLTPEALDDVARVPLARQRPRAAERHRACGGAGRRPHDRRRRPAARAFPRGGPSGGRGVPATERGQRPLRAPDRAARARPRRAATSARLHALLGLHRNSLKAKLARWKIRARDLRSDAQ